ncbi:distal tail protein Dit [Streptococcus cuniculi]|uniref:Phage tail protein n=1 Tax=Streptococcus cuniculi TaxID=1432788 RepID=A0A4Y9JCL5_9STRE|nr:distal tail protein Dit [Streptococcus cuniculi]MBF0778187.1 phage tail family protein [Streptococcus cuniculi]TFU97928.1 phage tail protein [Streptococcus cuniculi]
MSFTMRFNGVDMSRFFRITEIIRPIGNTRNVMTDEAPALGVNIQQIKVGPKEHTIKFDMKTHRPADMEAMKHELAGVLNVSKAVKITYSDEPDKYYMGLPYGDVTVENITRWFQRSEMKFLIPDGVAHSTSYKQFDSPTVSSDKVTFNLTNNGNVNAYPIITVKHHAENGYIGVVNTSGAFELGNREEADKETGKHSEILFDYRESKITTGLSSATAKNTAVLNDTSQTLRGTIGVDNSWGRPHLHLTNRGGTSGNNAGSLTWDIPADSAGAVGSLNDYIWWRQIFWAGASNQLGFIKVTVSDEQGQFLYGVETIKLSNGLDTQYNFFASDGKGGYNILKRWKFSCTHQDNHNPFNQNRGWSDLKRNNDYVTVYYWGGYHKIPVPQIRNKKSAKIHVALGAVGNRPLVTHMYLDSIYYRKDYVPFTRDIPNRYPNGSSVVIDSETDSVAVDGMKKPGDVVHGSRWLSIPPGDSKLELYFSSFIRTKPTVTVKFEERWL